MDPAEQRSILRATRVATAGVAGLVMGAVGIHAYGKVQTMRRLEQAPELTPSEVSKRPQQHSNELVVVEGTASLAEGAQPARSPSGVPGVLVLTREYQLYRRAKDLFLDLKKTPMEPRLEQSPAWRITDSAGTSVEPRLTQRTTRFVTSELDDAGAETTKPEPSVLASIIQILSGYVDCGTRVEHFAVTVGSVVSVAGQVAVRDGRVVLSPAVGFGSAVFRSKEACLAEIRGEVGGAVLGAVLTAVLAGVVWYGLKKVEEAI